jgi:hypothetical protein
MVPVAGMLVASQATDRPARVELVSSGDSVALAMTTTWAVQPRASCFLCLSSGDVGETL